MREVRQRDEGEDGLFRRAPTTRVSVLSALLAALGATGFLAAGSIAHSATGTRASVSLRATKLGRVLVNPRGHTLYLFVKDKKAKSACGGRCAKFWPPLLTRGRPIGGPGVRSSLLGTTRRSNGGLQVTYNKHPLYAYVLDKQAGQTNGVGQFAFGAKWYAVSARGTAVLGTPAAGTTTTGYTSSTSTDPYP